MPDPSTYHIAWWNVENLFDVRDSADRPEWLQRRLNNELKGWTREVLDVKIAQLVKVITSMNDGAGPDLLGVCEVENRPVMLGLIGALNAALNRQYEVAHHDCEDARGIDVGFIYDPARFELEETYSRVILKRNATRDLFQANFRTTVTGIPLIVVGNHWPARTAGTLESEPYRILAGETLSYWVERAQAVRGNNVGILCMGDFNDEPTDRSLVEYALSTRSPTKLSYARNPMLLNLMWPLMAAQGTHYWDNVPQMLDQFLVSRGLKVSSARLRYLPESVRVHEHPEMVRPGRYGGPLRFGRPSSASSYDPTGYSDHFPICMEIAER